MLIVTHELGALERLLTRIVVVDTGRISFDGTTQEYAAAATRSRSARDGNSMRILSLVFPVGIFFERNRHRELDWLDVFAATVP